MTELPFFETFESSVESKQFVKAVLSKPRNQNDDLKRIIIKPVTIKSKDQLSFIFRYATKDITKNHSFEESTSMIKELANDQFLIINLFTTKNDHILRYSKKGKAQIKTTPPTFKDAPDPSHDKIKKNYIQDGRYLIDLGILNQNGSIAKGAGNKYKQIQKYIEILDKLIEQSDLDPQNKEVSILDMGSGKGYLTFGLYDHLSHKFGDKVKITGIELRKELISFCNTLAVKMEYSNLSFLQGYINHNPVKTFDVLIALHACDTATDEAIYQGILGNAEMIVCAPCCHKQVRKSMNNYGPLEELTKYGILKERQAELATDAIRAMLLEAEGYKTKVFEFISSEHTGKNVMIAATKSKNPVNKKQLHDKIKALKSHLGIGSHHLENLLKN